MNRKLIMLLICNKCVIKMKKITVEYSMKKRINITFQTTTRVLFYQIQF